MRDSKAALKIENKAIEKVKGDVISPKSMTGLMRGCDAVVHLVGIIKENPGAGVTFKRMHLDATKHVVDEALASDIPRFIQMSANGCAI